MRILSNMMLGIGLVWIAHIHVAAASSLSQQASPAPVDCQHLLGEWEGRYNLLDQGMHVEWHWYWWEDSSFEGEITYYTAEETTVEFLAGTWSCDGQSYTNETYFSSQVALEQAGPWTLQFFFEELNHSYMRTRAEIDWDQWEVFEAIKIHD